jgi:hypothetical protein
MPAADRPSRATPRNRASGVGSHGAGNGARNGNGNGNGNGRGVNPEVPARREQRIERSPATVVRRAGEVRGRARALPLDDGDDSWSMPFDRAVPVGPASPDLALVVDADGMVVTDGPTTAPVPLGDITYTRLPAVTDSPIDATVAQPVIEAPPVPAAPFDHAAVEEPELQAGAAAVPAAPARPRRSLFKRRTRIRKVSRVVRRIDAWSVLKISLIFYALAYVVLLIAGVLLWNLAQTTGTVENIEGFVRELFGLEVFQIDGERLYRASWPIGVFLVVAGTGLNVTAAVMFNLITDLVGGVRVTVLEEEVRVVESGRRSRRGRSAPPRSQAG